MAKDTIGSMVAVVSATASGFARDLDSIGKDVTRFKRHVESSAPKGGMGDFLSGGLMTGAGIGAGFAAVQGVISAVTGTVQKFFDVIDSTENLQDFARQINASAEELQGLRFAAEVGGSSAEKLDSGIERMVRRLGEAREGSEEAKIAFEALGLSADNLAEMSAEDAFKAVADGIKNVENASDQAAIALEIFGRGNSSLLNVLNEGSDGIDKMIERGRELGAVMGEDGVNAAANASTAIKELKAAWGGLWNELTIAVIPALSTVVSWMTEIVGVASKAVNAIASIPFSPNGNYQREATEFEKAMAEVEAASRSAAEGVSQSNPISELKKRHEEAKQVQKELEDMMKRGAQVTKSNRTEQEIFNDELLDLAKLLEVGAIGWDTYSRAVTKAADDLDKAADSKRMLDRLTSTPGVSATASGTTAGFSQVQAGLRAQLDADRRQTEVQRDQLTEQRRHTELLKRIQTSLQDSTRVAGVNIN